MDTWCHLRVKGSIKTVTLAACVAHVAVPHWVAFATVAAAAAQGKQRWPARSTGQVEEVEGVWAVGWGEGELGMQSLFP